MVEYFLVNSLQRLPVEGAIWPASWDVRLSRASGRTIGVPFERTAGGKSRSSRLMAMSMPRSLSPYSLKGFGKGQWSSTAEIASMR
jgi:hypothetical protein